MRINKRKLNSDLMAENAELRKTLAGITPLIERLEELHTELYAHYIHLTEIVSKPKLVRVRKVIKIGLDK